LSQQLQQKSTPAPNMTNVLSLLQQIQQIQLQQKAAAAASSTMGVAQNSALVNDLRSQQESLMNQLASSQKAISQAQQQKQSRGQFNDPTSIDPAILDAGLTSVNASQSIWGDMPSKYLYL